MKSTVMIAVMMIADAAVDAQTTDLGAERSVPVCVDGAVSLGMIIAAQAQKIAAGCSPESVSPSTGAASSRAAPPKRFESV
jgi:hypothetical protein